jgi:hypothetical protein
MLELFGLEPYLGAILIAGIGVGITTVFGWLEGGAKYDPRKAATSTLIAIPTALIIVATELSAITLPDDGGLTALIVVAGLIAQVAGIDMFAKTTGALIKKQ